MAKDFVVVFSDSGARILKGIRPDEWRHEKNALINPVRPLGVAPHLWVKKGEKVGVITQAEYDAKNPPTVAATTQPVGKTVIRLGGYVKRAPEQVPAWVVVEKPGVPWWVWLTVAAALIGAAVYYFR